MAAGKASAFFNAIGLGSTRSSILMLVVAWMLHVVWLGINYFWNLVPVEVLLAVPVLLLLYAGIALGAYIYWGLKQVREQDAPFANVLVGVIVGGTLLYLNYTLLQFVLSVVQ
jgi:hypothetical protein